MKQAAERCIRCSEPPAPGRVRCEKHLAIARERASADYHERKNDGRCTWGGCNEPAAPERVRCAAHLLEAAGIVADIRARRKREQEQP